LPRTTRYDEALLRQTKDARHYDKLRSCPTARNAGPGTSKSQLSEPQISVNKTGDHATLLGHDAQRTDITMTQSCKVRDTGEEYQLAYQFDVWLTDSAPAGKSADSTITTPVAARPDETPSCPSS
jgi:hypothetical protein